MNHKKNQAISKSIIQSYVKEKYFVSTIYHQSSVSTESPIPWFYETIIWEWNKVTRKRGKQIDIQNSEGLEKKALKNHFEICQKLSQS